MDTDLAGQWRWLLPFEAQSAAAARAHLVDVLAPLGVDKGRIDDSCAVASELLANALRHARPRSQGVMELALVVDESSIRISVSDGGSATLPAWFTRQSLHAEGAASASCTP